MPAYSPGPACQRHVRRNETTCPFCTAALPPAPACNPGVPCGSIPRDAKRATVIALSLGLAATAACEDNQTPIYGASPPPGTAGTFASGGTAGRSSGGTSSGGTSSGGTAGTANTGGTAGTANTAGTDAGGAAGAAGAPTETDAGSDAQSDAS